MVVEKAFAKLHGSYGALDGASPEITRDHSRSLEVARDRPSSPKLTQAHTSSHKLTQAHTRSPNKVAQQGRPRSPKLTQAHTRSHKVTQAHPRSPSLTRGASSQAGTPPARSRCSPAAWPTRSTSPTGAAARASAPRHSPTGCAIGSPPALWAPARRPAAGGGAASPLGERASSPSAVGPQFNTAFSRP